MKKWITALLCTVLALSCLGALAGCVNNPNHPAPNNPTPETEAQKIERYLSEVDKTTFETAAKKQGGVKLTLHMTDVENRTSEGSLQLNATGEDGIFTSSTQAEPEPQIAYMHKSILFELHANSGAYKISGFFRSIRRCI